MKVLFYHQPDTGERLVAVVLGSETAEALLASATTGSSARTAVLVTAAEEVPDAGPGPRSREMSQMGSIVVETLLKAEYFFLCNFKRLKWPHV